MNQRFFRFGLLPLGCLVLILGTVSTLQALEFPLLHTFDDPTVTREDQFGFSVSIDGNRVLIGALWDDTIGSNVGQAHLFDATTGNLLHTFNDPTVTFADQFGSSVSVDGNHILIGAPRDDTNGNGVGQAHLFDATSGNLLYTYSDPTVTDRDRFGEAVAIDGSHVLIGAGSDDTIGSDVGQAHLFDATTGNLVRTFNNPVTTRDHFGTSVAIDGNHVLIGAMGDDINGNGDGQAHLFDATTGNLLHTFNDPTVTTDDRFGKEVAIDGNYVLIGEERDDTNGTNAGQAHLFDATTGDLLRTFSDPTVTTGDRFGSSVSVDGKHVLIGAWGDDTNGNGVGQAYLFDATTGNLLHTFNAPTATKLGRFGSSGAFDGKHVLIGAFRDGTNGRGVGQAYLFDIRVPEPGTGGLLVGMALVASGCRRRCRASRP